MPDPAMLDYFYGGEAEQYTFYRIPKVLFTDPGYRRISSAATIIYVKNFIRKLEIQTSEKRKSKVP